jgi:toxin ParE1/3/4
MIYRVVRHPLVRDDVFAITVFIGQYAGYDVADAKIDTIEAKLTALGDFPYVGTVRNEISPGLRVVPAAGKAVICFTVDDYQAEVYVVCISYGGADWEARVKERQ